MNGRRQILNSIRRALGPHRDPPAPPRRGETEPGGERAILVERFVVEAVAVDAEVLRGPSEEILEKRFGAEGVAGALLPSHPIPRDGREVHLAITRAEWGIADTGTVVEFHPAGSQSAASSGSKGTLPRQGRSSLTCDPAGNSGFSCPQSEQ